MFRPPWRTARPVKVLPQNITPTMSAPVIVDRTHPVGDITSGKSTERLFDEAVKAGALVGAGLRLQCVGDDEGRDNTFVLIALISNGQSQRGATTGRRPTWRIGALDDDPDNRETDVREALDYFAAELNYAIAGWRAANRILSAREAILDVLSFPLYRCVRGRTALFLAQVIAAFRHRREGPTDPAHTLARHVTHEYCDAQDWRRDEDGEIVVWGTCEMPLGHDGNLHRDFTKGEVWHEWFGPAEQRAPVDSAPEQVEKPQFT